LEDRDIRKKAWGSRGLWDARRRQWETEADAWKGVLAYARRWQIEVMCKGWKRELGMPGPRVWDWETRLKLWGLATLASAFVLRSAAHRSGRRLRATRVPQARLESLVVGLSTSLESTCQASSSRELTADPFSGRPAVPLR
jgi:hypothetical protein